MSSTLTATTTAKTVRTLSNAMRDAVKIATRHDSGERRIPISYNSRTIEALIRRGIVRSDRSTGRPRNVLTDLGLAVRAWLIGDDESIGEVPSHDTADTLDPTADLAAAMRQVGAGLNGIELSSDEETQEAELLGLTVAQLREARADQSDRVVICGHCHDEFSGINAALDHQLEQARRDRVASTVVSEGYDFVRGGVSRMDTTGHIINSLGARTPVGTVDAGAVRAAFGDALNALGKTVELSPLSWTYQSDMNPSGTTGHASQGDYAPEEIPNVLTAWATFLRLSERDDAVRGTREFTGSVDGFACSVWGVIDNATFENQCKPQL